MRDRGLVGSLADAGCRALASGASLKNDRAVSAAWFLTTPASSNLHAVTHDAEAASGHPCAVDGSSMAPSIGSRDGGGDPTGGELTSCTLSSGYVP